MFAYMTMGLDLIGLRGSMQGVSLDVVARRYLRRPYFNVTLLV